MAQIPLNKYGVVVDESNNIIVEQGKLCIQHIEDGTCLWVPMTPQVMQLFNLENAVTHQVGEEPESEVNDGNGNKKWCRNSTLMLINMYQKYDSKFKSTTIKNDRVWDLLARELCQNNFNFSASQCKERWKYLKSRYMRKVDNMKQTGEATFKFEFFSEMNEVLGKKPNVAPIAVASSSRQVNDVPETTEDALVEKQNKKRKHESEALTILKEIRETSMQREENRERRHRELMAMKEKAIDSYNNKMEALLKKL